MNNTNPGNCMEFLNVRNSYNYNQYVQEAGEIIREFSGEVAHFPSSNVEKERRQTGNQRFIANQLMADCLQQTMPLPEIDSVLNSIQVSNGVNHDMVVESDSVNSGNLNVDLPRTLESSFCDSQENLVINEENRGSAEDPHTSENVEEDNDPTIEYCTLSTYDNGCVMDFILSDQVGMEVENEQTGAATNQNVTASNTTTRRRRRKSNSGNNNVSSENSGSGTNGAGSTGDASLSNNNVSESTPSRKKRCKVTQDERNLIKNIYESYPDKRERMRHAQNTFKHISREYLSFFFNKLKRGESIDLATTKRGRKRVINNDCCKEIVRYFDENPLAHDTDCAHHIHTEFGIEVSRPTIQRIRTDHEIMKAIGAKPITVKVATLRGKTAQSDENKQRRIDVVNQIKALPSKYRMVYVDETHIEIYRKYGYAKSARGTRALVNHEGRGYKMSCICAISADGPLYSLVHEKGNVNSQSFTAYFAKLAKSLENEYVCFYMDNAAIHKRMDLEKAMNPQKHLLIFGAPYSPDMNPIENVFGCWKRVIEEFQDEVPTEVQMRHILSYTWHHLDKQLFRSCVGRVIDDIYPAVLNRCDM